MKKTYEVTTFENITYYVNADYPSFDGEFVVFYDLKEDGSGADFNSCFSNIKSIRIINNILDKDNFDEISNEITKYALRNSHDNSKKMSVDQDLKKTIMQQLKEIEDFLKTL